jgi:hypothetical protein
MSGALIARPTCAKSNNDLEQDRTLLAGQSRKSRQPGEEVSFPPIEQMRIPTAGGYGSAPVDTDRISVGIIRAGWRVCGHHVEPGDAVLSHHAVRGSASIVALACVVTAQHAEQARQALAVDDEWRHRHCLRPFETRLEAWAGSA